MQQTEHIAERDFIGYSKRELAAAETLRVQRHVAVCDACSEKLALVFDAQTSFSAVQNNFAFDDFSGELEHLPYEQLALFVDEKLDEVDREIAESHFAICLECAKDLNDLRSYRAIADAPILTNEAKISPPLMREMRFRIRNNRAKKLTRATVEVASATPT